MKVCVGVLLPSASRGGRQTDTLSANDCWWVTDNTVFIGGRKALARKRGSEFVDPLVSVSVILNLYIHM